VAIGLSAGEGGGGSKINAGDGGGSDSRDCAFLAFQREMFLLTSMRFGVGFGGAMGICGLSRRLNFCQPDVSLNQF
jgi:hypothetical protein